MFTQLDVKQLMIFGRTVVAASDLKNCTMVNCDNSSFALRAVELKRKFSHDVAQLLSNSYLISSFKFSKKEVLQPQGLIRVRDNQSFFMLNSAEHDIYICWHFNIYYRDNHEL